MKPARHVITGGPCSGKTTTIQSLSRRGFSVIPEASRLLIEQQLRSGGDLVPWKRLHDFNVRVTALQQQLESQVTDGAVFLDRGIIDNLAYCEWGKISPPAELQDAVRKARYSSVFLLQPLGLFENDAVRTENSSDAVELAALIRKHYLRHGYRVIDVPPAPVEERVELILSRI